MPKPYTTNAAVDAAMHSFKEAPTQAQIFVKAWELRKQYGEAVADEFSDLAMRLSPRVAAGYEPEMLTPQQANEEQWSRNEAAEKQAIADTARAKRGYASEGEMDSDMGVPRGLAEARGRWSANEAAEKQALAEGARAKQGYASEAEMDADMGIPRSLAEARAREAERKQAPAAKPRQGTTEKGSEDSLIQDALRSLESIKNRMVGEDSEETTMEKRRQFLEGPDETYVAL